MLNSIPKSGTHLLLNVFRQLPSYLPGGFTITRDLAGSLPGDSNLLLAGIGDPRWIDGAKLAERLGGLMENSYLQGHCPYTEEMNNQFVLAGIRTVLILRDPRDVVCSYENYIMNSPTHYLHSYLVKMRDNHSRLMAVIDGVVPTPENGFLTFASICDQFRSIEGWLKEENVLVVTFEQLVGESGNGSLDQQQDAVRQILDFVSYPVDGKIVPEISSQLYSKASPTFHRGQIGAWRERFDSEITEAFATKGCEALRIYSTISDRLWPTETK